MPLSILEQQIHTHFPAQQHFLVGLSGGIDSIVLLHLLARLPVKLRAVHIHHGLSSNADDWAAFCQMECKRLNIPFILQKVNVDKTNGIEAGARSARYQAIKEIILPNEVLVTAHHLNDQAETFFLALKRGSGIKGLGAMQAVSFWQNFAIFRPLLNISKQQITNYATAHQLSWIEDESNQDSHYDRNFLRNEVLPILNQRWQHFSQMVARSAQHCAEQQQLLEELLNTELSTYADFTEKSLNIEKFNKFSQVKQQQLIRLWLEKCSLPMPTRQQLIQILADVVHCAPDRNPQFQLGSKILRRFQQRIYLTKEFAETKHFLAKLEAEEVITLPDGIGEIIYHSEEIIYKKEGKSDRLLLPQQLRRQSITIKLHHSGKVKRYQNPMREEMKKLYQQAQIPTWQRSRTPLVFVGEQFIGMLKLHHND